MFVGWSFSVAPLVFGHPRSVRGHCCCIYCYHIVELSCSSTTVGHLLSSPREDGRPGAYRRTRANLSRRISWIMFSSACSIASSVHPPPLSLRFMSFVGGKGSPEIRIPNTARHESIHPQNPASAFTAAARIGPVFCTSREA